MLTVQRLSASVRRLLVPPRSLDDRNAYFLCAEVVLAGLIAAASSFNSAYILRLGGSNALIGLLSSLPALVAVLLHIPCAHFLEKRANYAPWVTASLLVARLGFLVIAVLPLLTGRHLPELTVAVLVAIAIPSVLFATGWSPLLSDTIPAHRRASVLAWRSILSSATIAPLLLLAGQWLDRAAFPGNYQWMYAISWVVSGLGGVYLVSLVRLRSQEGAAPAAPAPRARAPLLAGLRTAAAQNPGFVRIVANTFLFNLGAWMVGPLFMIFYVRQLGASDGWVGLLGMLAHLGVICGYTLWRRIIRRIGEGRTLLVSVPLVCIHPLLVALVPNLGFILFVEFLINVIAAGVNLSHGILFLGLLPEGRKHSSTAIHSMVMNVGAFICPLIGVALAESIGIVPTLLIGAGMRLAGAFLFHVFPVKQVEARPQVA